MNKLDPDFRPVGFVWGNVPNSHVPNSLRRKPKSILAAIWVSAILVGGGSALAEMPSTLQQLGRIVGAGWGDGYHACKCSEGGLCADFPPRPYCQGNCDGQCGQNGCNGCGDIIPCDSVPCDSRRGSLKMPGLFGHGILGNVNETGLALKAGSQPACRNVPCNDLHCKSPGCKLKLKGNVNETGLAIKAAGGPRCSNSSCDLPPRRHLFHAPVVHPPVCDTACDVNDGTTREFPVNHDGSGGSIEHTLPHPVTDSPFIEIPADSAMNQAHPHLAPKLLVEELAPPVVKSEKRVAVSVLAAPQPSPEPVVEVRRPVRIAQGKVKPRSAPSTASSPTSVASPATVSSPATASKPAPASSPATTSSPALASKLRIAISDPLPSNVQINRFAEAASDVPAETKPVARSPQRLPMVR